MSPSASKAWALLNGALKQHFEDRQMAETPMNETRDDLSPDALAFYRHVLDTLEKAGVPVLVGGAYAFTAYTGIERQTKDLDLFLRRADFDRAAEALEAVGYETELTHPHWLGKAHSGPIYVDLIFCSGNGLTEVDDSWFAQAPEGVALGVPVKMMPVEEMIWSKAFIMERERYDGADVAHLLRSKGRVLDWQRLLDRVGPHWRVLLSHLVLFGFIYPAERDEVPAWVMHLLLEQLREETRSAPPQDERCQGTLLSRAQYLHDIRLEGYEDGRETPAGPMTSEEIAAWTQAIDDKDEHVDPPRV
jgi:hypothetical protein